MLFFVSFHLVGMEKRKRQWKNYTERLGEMGFFLREWSLLFMKWKEEERLQSNENKIVIGTLFYPYNISSWYSSILALFVHEKVMVFNIS